MDERPTGTVTFMFTDVEGSTRLLGELGPEGYGQALAEHRRLLRDAFARHGGFEVDTQGDAFFVAFADAGEALAAATEAQRALDTGPAKVRIALHTGEPLLTPEGYVGMDVHRAARICSTAHGGQVLLSGPTKALIDRSDVVDLGLHRLKDMVAPERLFQLGPGEFPPVRSLNATNLPVLTSALIGRGREVEQLARLAASFRLVTVTGPGGTGKTRVALQVAAELVAAFPDGVFWVSLAPVTDPELVLPTVAQALGVKGQLAEQVDEQRILLLLDNLEHVMDAAPRIAELLETCPNLHLLVTSRASLRVEGEREYRLEPLSIDDAVTLFRERADVGEPVEAVAEICRRVDCLPLAVELAAARTTLLPPSALLARLEHRLPLLTVGRRDAPARQRTLRATIEWSHELLDEAERRLFRRLAVFPGSFDVAAAESIAGAGLETLQTLVEQSLVWRESSGRLGILETIRELATERLEDAGEVEDTHRRHAEYMLALAESANLCDEAEGPQRIDLVRPEAANMRAALQWWLVSGDIDLAGRLAVALEHFWVATSPFEGARWFEQLLGRADGLALDLRAPALRVWGGVLNIVGRLDEATDLYEESLACYRRLGDERGVGILLYRLAVPALVRGDTARARSLVEESGELLRRLRFRKGQAVVLGTLADIEFEEGHNDRGLELQREAIALADEVGFWWWKAVNLSNLAAQLAALDRLEEAEEAGLEALAATHAVGERQFVIFCLAELARIAARTGRAERAGTLWSAIETEEKRGPVGQWESYRDEYATAMLAVAGPDFDRGRRNARRFTLDEVVEYALAPSAG